MTTAPNGGSTPGHEANGDLTRIKGIGSAKRQWLQDELDICTVQDLARASANQIHRQLRDAGHSISVSEIRNWIAQAEVALGQGSSQDKPEADQDSSPSVSGELALPDDALSVEPAAFEAQGESIPGDDDWSTLATFTVAFQSRAVAGGQDVQTLVRHLERNSSLAWPGSKREDLQQWMLDQMQPVTSSSTSPTGLAKTSEGLAKREVQEVQVDYIYLVQPSQVGSPILFDPGTKVVSGCLYANRPFSLEFLLGQGKNQTQTLGLQEFVAPCRIQLAAKQLTPPQKHEVVEATVSVTGVEDTGLLKAALQNLQLSDGLYQLEVLISFPEFSHRSTFAEIPRLQVF